MSNLGLAGGDIADPVTFIVTLGGYVPSAFALLNAGCMLIGLVMVANAITRQMATARGRSDHTATQNVMHACFGAALAVLAEIIGAYGKGVFGDFESASVLLYVAKQDNNLARTAMAAFLFLIQFIGAFSCAFALRVADRLATNKPYPGETWNGVLMFALGGLACVFIQKTIGILSVLSGMPLSRFINNL